MTTKTLFAIAIITALALGSTAPAMAQDESPLTRCVLDHITRPDETALVQWMVFNMASDPAYKDAVQVMPNAVDNANRAMAAVVTRLLTKDCRRETGVAVAKDGAKALGAPFRAFGQTAATRALSKPYLDEAMGKFSEYIDEAAFDGIEAEDNPKRR